MVETVPTVIFGAHVVVAGFFGLIGIAGLLGEAGIAAAAVRFLIAALVLALGVVVARVAKQR